MKKIWLLLIVLFLFSPAVLAQGGPYNLTIEGAVRRNSGTPAAYKTVILTTTANEILKTETDWEGRFTLTGAVTGDSGVLEVKSESGVTSFGSVAVTWAAGGPGDKYLTANLSTDGTALEATGSELPPTSTPSLFEVTPATLPTATVVNNRDAPPALSDNNSPTAPSPTLDDGGSNLFLLLILSLGGLIGLGLIGGGVFYLVRNRA